MNHTPMFSDEELRERERRANAPKQTATMGHINMKKYTFIEDPGHAWLSVPLSDIQALCIADHISSYSYMSPTRAYLEEDCDATLFINTADAAGWQYQIRESYTENWKGRYRWPSFDRYFIDHPFQVGSRVSFHNGTQGTVSKIGKRYFINTDRGLYRAHSDNPLIGIYPPS